MSTKVAIYTRDIRSPGPSSSTLITSGPGATFGSQGGSRSLTPRSLKGGAGILYSFCTLSKHRLGKECKRPKAQQSAVVENLTMTQNPFKYYLEAVFCSRSRDGGRCWIRTSEGVSQQIYSVHLLAILAAFRGFEPFVIAFCAAICRNERT